MTEGNGKEKDHPSENKIGNSPQDDHQAVNGQDEIIENAEKSGGGTSSNAATDESAESRDTRLAEQSASSKAAEKISGEMEAVEDFDLNLLLDIPLEITVELGRARIQIHELLELGPGSAITLSRLEGEPVDILANEKLIARGEVVLQNKKYGIRITEITSRMNRIKGLA